MTVLTLTTGKPGKYGFVRVSNPDGSINREFRITEAELSQLQRSGNGIPPGVTKQEWTDGLATVTGVNLDIGDMEVNEDGSILIKLDERPNNGRVQEKHLRMKAGDYLGIPPLITVTPDKLLVGITSIVAGVITYDPDIIISVPKSIGGVINGSIN